MARWIGDLDQFKFKPKAVIALLPYAVRQERVGGHRMSDAFSRVARAPMVETFMAQSIATLLSEAGPDYPNLLVTFMSPYAYWGLGSDTSTVTRWAEAVLAVPYTEEVGQSVVDALLQIAPDDDLRPYIPVDVWALLKKRPSLPPICEGRTRGTKDSIVRRVRELGDVDILESYLLLVWSEWDFLFSEGLAEMGTSIREDLSGIGMGHRREFLVKRLDHVLGQLDRGFEHLSQHNPSLDEDHIPIAKGQYEELKEVLLEVDKEGLEILTRASFRLITSFDSLTCPLAQNPTQRSLALSLSHVRSRTSVTSAVRSSTPYFIYTLVPLCSPFELHRTSSNSSNHAHLPPFPNMRNAMSWLPR